MDPKDANTLDYLYLLARRWKFIVANLFGVCAVAAVISLLLPEWYRATTVILPPKEEKKGEFAGFAGALAKLPIPVIRLGEKGSPADIFMGILKSRTVLDSVVSRFNLMKAYDVDTKEEAIRNLEENTTVRKTDEGLISVSVIDKSPQRAADMANAYIEFLDTINRKLGIEWERDRLKFIQEQYDRSVKVLLAAQDSLKTFQTRYYTISLTEQAKATIEAAAELQKEIMGLRISLWSKEASMGPTHPEVEMTKKRIKFREKQLAALISEGSSNPGDSRLFLPLDEIPELQARFFRLHMEVEIQRAIVEFLRQELEKKRIEATPGRIATVQVVDPAVPPQMRAKPKRKLIVVMSGIFSIIFSVFAVLAVEYFHAIKEKGDEDSEKLKRILNEFKWRKKRVS